MSGIRLLDPDLAVDGAKGSLLQVSGGSRKRPGRRSLRLHKLRASTLTVRVISPRVYEIKDRAGSLAEDLPGTPGSRWDREQLIGRASRLGWRLDRQEPDHKGTVQLTFIRRFLIR